MSQIEVPDWVVEAAVDEIRLAKHTSFDRWTDQQAMRAALTAALGAWVVPQHQAQWIVEQCWEDITTEQFADLEETEAVTRTLYDLRQEKPE